MVPPKDDEDLEGALNELTEYQREAERIGKMVVDGVKQIVESREELAPGANDVFAGLHGKWYGAAGRDLATAGIRDLGPFKVAGSTQPPERDTYYRFGISEDRTIVASWFMFAAVEQVPCVVLQSFAVDGSMHVTASGITVSGVPLRPNQTERLLPADAPIGGMVKLHRRDLERAARAFRQLDGMEDILATRQRDAEETRAFRKAQGLKLFEPYLRYQFKENYDERGVEILATIMEHPEWWTGEELA